jgi:hypothetical protein
MRRSLMPYVCLNAAAALGCLQAQTTFTVEIYNYAGVPAGTLVNAEKEAARIFRAAGIELSWAPCPVSDRDFETSPAKFGACGKTPNAPVLRIEAEGSRRRGPVAAITREDRVWFSYTWIQRNCELYGVAPAVLLGHVMAHELGHVLLGDDSHARDGIMIPTFSEAQFRRAQTGILLFDGRQAAQMRAALSNHTTTASARTAN